MSEQTKPHLFIIEDDEAWAATLTGKLSKRFNVTHFSNGESGLEKLLSLKPKIIILDFHLNGGGGTMNGLEVLREIKKRFAEVIVVVLSGQDDVQVAVDILKNGAFDYVTKGSTALNRLNLILRKIERQDELRSKYVALSFSAKRSGIIKLAGVGVGLLLILVIYIINKG